MKKLLLSASALALMSSVAMAADLAPAPVEPVAVIAPFSWTGFYVGANAGYGWGSSSVDIAGLGKIGDWSSDGFVGGVQAGYNYQINQFVLGAEIDADFSGIDGTFNLGGPTALKTELNWFGTGRLRAGYAFDRALFFVTGGVAVGDVKNTANLGVVVTQSDTTWGWTLGAGIEYAFTDNWSTKLEYRHVDLGDNSHTVAIGGGAGTRLEYKNNFDIVTVGVNYRF